MKLVVPAVSQRSLALNLTIFQVPAVSCSLLGVCRSPVVYLAVFQVLSGPCSLPCL